MKIAILRIAQERRLAAVAGAEASATFESKVADIVMPGVKLQPGMRQVDPSPP